MIVSWLEAAAFCDWLSVTGNASEWCLDPWSETPPAEPAVGWRTDDGEASRAHRGGAYNSGPGLAEIASRNYCFASASFNRMGFRILVQ